MRKYKIGITEAGDAGDDLSWKDKVDDLDGAILITKNVNPEFSKLVVDNKNIFVVHATTTGYGGTVLEPNVQKPSKQLQEIKNLINLGFPKERIVIRVDPIIPTRKGGRYSKKCNYVIYCRWF